MDRKILARELAKLMIYYPHPPRSPEEAEVLTKMWAEDLECVTDKEFAAAISKVRRRSRFFPNPAEIIEQVRADRPRPPEPTLEELRR